MTKRWENTGAQIGEQAAATAAVVPQMIGQVGVLLCLSISSTHAHVEGDSEPVICRRRWERYVRRQVEDDRDGIYEKDLAVFWRLKIK